MGHVSRTLKFSGLSFYNDFEKFFCDDLRAGFGAAADMKEDQYGNNN